MSSTNYKHPLLYYGLSIFFSWILWFTAAYLSHYTKQNNWINILELAGLLFPFILSLVLIFTNKALTHDFVNRFFNFDKSKWVYYVLVVTLMLGSLLLAQIVSLFFGYSTLQFNLALTPSFTSKLISPLAILFLAPLIEELAWHTYGTDCLRSRFNLFTTNIIFALFWGIWHVPLSFIKDYYHSNLAEQGWIYSLNFFVSLFPFVFIINWLYYKTNRNIIVAIVFHITAGFFIELFNTHPDSKIIQTLLLLAFSIMIVNKEKALFFNKNIIAQ